VIVATVVRKREASSRCVGSRSPAASRPDAMSASISCAMRA